MYADQNHISNCIIIIIITIIIIIFFSFYRHKESPLIFFFKVISASCLIHFFSHPIFFLPLEAGYIATPICIVQAAMVILEETLPNR